MFKICYSFEEVEYVIVKNKYYFYEFNRKE